MTRKMIRTGALTLTALLAVCVAQAQPTAGQSDVRPSRQAGQTAGEATNGRGANGRMHQRRRRPPRQHRMQRQRRVNQSHGRRARPRGRRGNARRVFQSIHRAVAVLRPTQGNDVYGVVTFDQQRGGRVKVTANVTGLEPNSVHGFHVHQYGDATGPHGKSAGGHYNPQHHDHHLPPQRPRHAGDLGNLKANAQGKARKQITVNNITLAGPVNPILGRGVVVHAKRDHGTQPTGDAGSRVAVGVIGVAQPPNPRNPSTSPNVGHARGGQEATRDSEQRHQPQNPQHTGPAADQKQGRDQGRGQ